MATDQILSCGGVVNTFISFGDLMIMIIIQYSSMNKKLLFSTIFLLYFRCLRLVFVLYSRVFKFKNICHVLCYVYNYLQLVSYSNERAVCYTAGGKPVA